MNDIVIDALGDPVIGALQYTLGTNDPNALHDALIKFHELVQNADPQEFSNLQALIAHLLVQACNNDTTPPQWNGTPTKKVCFVFLSTPPYRIDTKGNERDHCTTSDCSTSYHKHLLFLL
jgi:hypothetical protein